MSHVDEGTLHAYLDGELSPAEAQGVDAHVAQCAGCRERLDVERALINRTHELMALAVPPDRDVPPFRAGDRKPPARLWWQVRLPLAWAATVALALGFGTYLGGRGGPPIAPAPYAHSNEMADRLAPSAPAPAPETVAAVERARREAPAARRARPLQPAAPPAPDARAIAEAQAEKRPRAADSLVGLRTRDEAAAALESSPVAAKAAMAAPARPEPSIMIDGGYVLKGSSITPDTARLVLGRDPLVIPDLPIRGIYQGRMIGYSGLVIVEQALDSTTLIRVVNGHSAPVALSEVVVTGAGRADAARPDTAPAPAAAPGLYRQRAATDSLAARPRSEFFVQIVGPLSPDSLAALRRKLQPLRP